MKEQTNQPISPTGIWSEGLADSGAHKHDVDLQNAICTMFGDPRATLIDYGCGKGEYLTAFQDVFLTVLGYEGTSVTSPLVVRQDLTDQAFISRPCDVGVCLEVGEHIPPAHFNQFMENITQGIREWLVLSWAVPGQGGDGHVNELPPHLVTLIMMERGFKPDNVKGQKLRGAATLPWFANTIQVFRAP